MSKELKELEFNNKKLNQMSYDEIDKVFRETYGLYSFDAAEIKTLWLPDINEPYKGSYMTKEEINSYYEHEIQRTHGKKIIDLQEQLTNAPIPRSPQTAYFYILSLIIGTKVEVKVKEKISEEKEKTYDKWDEASQQFIHDPNYHGETSRSREKITSFEAIGNASDLVKAINLRDQVAETMEQKAREDFIERVNNQIATKVGVNLKILKEGCSDISKKLEDIDSINSEVTKKLNNLRDAYKKIKAVDKEFTMPEYYAMESKLKELKENFEKKIEKNPTTNLISIYDEYLKLIKVITFEQATIKQISQIAQNIEEEKAAKEGEKAKEKINEVRQKGSEIHDEIIELYNDFDSSRSQFMNLTIKKEEFDKVRKVTETKLNKALEKSATYINEFKRMPISEKYKESEACQSLQALANNMKMLGEYIERREKLLKALQHVGNKLSKVLKDPKLDDKIKDKIRLFDDLKENTDENILFVVRAAIEEIKDHESMNEDLPKQYELKSLVQEYGALRVLETKLNPDNLDESIKAFDKSANEMKFEILHEKKSVEMSWQSILEKNATAKKSIFEKAGEFFRKVGLSIESRLYPERAEENKRTQQMFDKQALKITKSRMP